MEFALIFAVYVTIVTIVGYYFHAKAERRKHKALIGRIYNQSWDKIDTNIWYDLWIFGDGTRVIEPSKEQITKE